MRKVFFAVIIIGSFLGLNISNGYAVDESSPAYKEALGVAKAVDIFVRATRAKYTQKAVAKLKKDGTGAARDSAAKKGFIPLPAQFIREVSFQTALVQRKMREETFEFFLRSRWNLNPEQGLEDDFEKTGWKFLADQQKNALSAGTKFRNIKWKPYVRVETVKGKNTLRYLSSDVGSARPCVRCHNKWEQKDEVKNMRKAQGIKAGKKFEMHELMGAVSINVPLK